MGTLGNLAGLIVHARLGQRRLPAAYDRRFSQTHFGLYVACPRPQHEQARRMLQATGAEEIHAIG